MIKSGKIENLKTADFITSPV